MRYGISAGAILVEEKRILLVHHQDNDKYDFWVPPGGSLEGNESIYDCAKREVFEETGLDVKLGSILYIQEFWEPNYHFCKFFILGNIIGGELTLSNKDLNEDWLVDAKFFSLDEIQKLTVFPEILKGQFWTDVEAEIQITRYLGLERLRF